MSIRYPYKPILIFMLITWYAHGSSQSCYGIVNLNGKLICVKDIVSPPSSLECRHLKDSIPSNGDVELFVNYFHASSLSEYKSLFIASEWYGLTERDFNEWKAYLKGRDLKIESIVRFAEGGITYSCIQFYVIADGMYDRDCFLSKKINNHWYPTSETDDVTFQYESSLFRSVRPQFLSYLLDKTESSAMRNSGRAASLRSQVMNGDEVNAVALMVDREKINSYKSEDYQTLYYNLKELVDPEAFDAADRLHDGEFIAYMDSLQVPENKKTEVLELIRNFDYLKAAVRIARFQGTEINTTIHTEAIRRIYGPGRLTVVVAKAENE